MYFYMIVFVSDCSIPFTLSFLYSCILFETEEERGWIVERERERGGDAETKRHSWCILLHLCFNFAHTLQDFGDLTRLFFCKFVNPCIHTVFWVIYCKDRSYACSLGKEVIHACHSSYLGITVILILVDVADIWNRIWWISLITVTVCLLFNIRITDLISTAKDNSL